MTEPNHVAFGCADFDAMRAGLDALGVAYTLSAYTLSEVPLRRQVQIFFQDPAGNGVELNFAHDGA